MKALLIVLGLVLYVCAFVYAPSAAWRFVWMAWLAGLMAGGGLAL